MKLEIRQTPFDPLADLASYQESLTALKGRYGATAVFIGTMRDFNEGEAIQRMILEHYPGMTEHHLEKIARQALRRWELLDILVIHRVGVLYPQDPIVLIGAWSAHRVDAFEACRFIMEDLKSKAPFWKKESTPGQERWVEKNTAGYSDGPRAGDTGNDL